MQVIVNNVFLSLDDEEDKLEYKLAKILRIQKEEIESYKIIKKAVDARKKQNIIFVYSLLVTLKHNIDISSYKDVCVPHFIEKLDIPVIKMKHRPVVVGFGPSGMFLALYLARANTNPIVIERGKSVEERDKDILNFKTKGEFLCESNTCFGEGGAGTYSDGKLTTGIKDPRIRFCLNEFIKHGAPKNIYYEAHPHIGSDYLKSVVKNIRQEIISLGGEVLFEHKLVDLNIINNKISSVTIEHDNKKNEIKTDDVILAIGHSARDTFKMLFERNIFMQPKPFSMGVRIEHLQSEVNKSQYGKEYKNKKLPVADYKLAVHLPNGRTLYSFCMCPGGVVVGSNTMSDSIVTNGMSFFKRDLENANSALLVNVNIEDYYKSSPLDGMYYQEKYEKLAFNKNYPYFAPMQRVDDFILNQETKNIGRVKPSYQPGVYFTNLNKLLPDFVGQSLKLGIPLLAKKYPFFKDYSATMTGIETRSSSPIKIPRNEIGETNIIGVYPCGEGASYAGGIMSAAIDGLRIGEFIKNKYNK